jgi:hypothetical protein
VGERIYVRRQVGRKKGHEASMKKIVALIVGLALMAPSAALAQGGSTCQSYNPQLCSVSSNTQAKTTATTSASTLPFTGLDVLLLAAGGGALLGAGLLVRRLSRDFD